MGQYIKGVIPENITIWTMHSITNTWIRPYFTLKTITINPLPRFKILSTHPF